jgi:hypothetical protein
VRIYQETGKPPNVVNLSRKTPATCALVVRHLDRPGVLASVLDAISAAKINVQEMESGGCKVDCVNGHRMTETGRTDGNRPKADRPTTGRL